MAQILISKIKTRRGLDSQIKSTVYDQGELVSSIDTQRLFIGTGTGRYVVGSKAHLPLINLSSLTTLKSEVGDIVSCDNRVYQLTAIDYTNTSNWKDITSLGVDPVNFTISSDYTLSLNPSSISADYLNSSTVLSGVKIENGVLQTNLSSGLKIISNAVTLDYNTKSLEISAGSLGLKSEGIDEREIASSTLSSGLTGGSGSKIGINANPTYFQLSSGQLDLKMSNVSSSLSSSLTVDNSSIIRVDNKIQINNNVESGSYQWPMVSSNSYGLVTYISSAIHDCLLGDSSLSGYNSTSPLSSIFNGVPNTTDFGIPLSSLSAQYPDIPLSALSAMNPLGSLSANYDALTSSPTLFTAISSDGLSSSQVVTLTSSGFVTFEYPLETSTGKTVNRFAIPIFAY